MAIFRFEVKIIGRADKTHGRSVVAAAAYRSGSKLRDEKYSKTHDYSRRAAGIVHSEIVTPEGSPGWLRCDSRRGANYDESQVRAALWNTIEAIEDTHNRRDTARLSREFVLALPWELTREQRRALVMGFVRGELVSQGMVADVAIHEPKQGKNFHTHILTTLRPLSAEGFGQKAREWDKKELLVHWRKAWATAVNDALESAGHPGRVDYRSLADQGLDRLPQPKIGVAASALERKGIATDRGKASRLTAMKNHVLPHMRDIERYGEVQHEGIGAHWWERAQVAIRHMQHAGGDLPGEGTTGGNSGAAAPRWQQHISGQRDGDTGPQRGR